MVQFNSNDALKRFLIDSQLITAQDWDQVDLLFRNVDDVQGIVNKLAEMDAITPLQRNRILHGEAESLLLGNYKLLYRNGSGSFSRVFRASTRDGGQTVALKLLRERWAQDPASVKGFHREARICQRFRHPNIVPIYEICSEQNNHFITMEFVEGGNLRDFLRIRDNVTPAESAQCLYDICSALNYVNSLDTTHRDLKLTNVLMSSNRTAKLVDFGLAGADSTPQSFVSDGVRRALEYASLEKGTNAPKNDPRSDIFFAGAILYELLSGESPWLRTRDREERKQLSRYTQIRPLHTFRPDLPQSMLDITSRMMEVSPSVRYQTAEAVCSDLKAALQEFDAWNKSAHQPVPHGTSQVIVSDFHLLVVDTIATRKDALKQYFNKKHGFRLSFSPDPPEALNQLKGRHPPAGILFLADTTRDAVLNIFPEVQAWGRTLKVHCLAVFPEDDEDLIRRTITSTKFGSTMFQPATPRDIRRHFETIGGISPELDYEFDQPIE